MNVISSASGRRSSTGGIAKATTTTNMTPSKSKLIDYEERLNFYTESPHVELSIDDFEVLALKRLKVGAHNASRLDKHSTACSSLARLDLFFF